MYLPFKKPAVAFYQRQAWSCVSGVGIPLMAVQRQAKKPVLGLGWNVQVDSMFVPPEVVEDPVRWSRRLLLKLVASIFDPLGFVTPFTITGKILLQKSWKEKTEWDASFNSDWQLNVRHGPRNCVT